MEAKVYQHIARKFDAYLRCKATGNSFADNHEDSVNSLVNGWLPSGSGIDAGVVFDFDESKPNRLVFVFSYHHMDENGYYTGWSDYKLVVSPSLLFGADIKIIGRDKNDIKDYLYQTFEYSLNLVVEA